MPTSAWRKPSGNRRGQASGGTGLLTEDSVKAAAKTHLETAGWTVTVAWGRERGIDIEAHRGAERLYLEAKGEAANPPQQVNYFLAALGELVQRLPVPRLGTDSRCLITRSTVA